MAKKLLALLVAVMMVIAIMPMHAFAAADAKAAPIPGHKDEFVRGYDDDYVPPAEGNARVILTVGDVWGDGSGYQMLLDADATAYGSTFPTTGPLTSSGDATESVYAEFEYKIPENADGACATTNIIIEDSVTIEIPAGTYDWCITNPTPGDRIWIASDQGSVGGRADDYLFEEGYTYEFTVSLMGSNDGTDVTITDTTGYTPDPPTPVVGFYFEDEAEFAEFTIISNDTNSYTWERYGSSAFEGSYCARVHWQVAAEDWMITPAVDIPEVDPTVTFYGKAHSGTYDELVQVFVGSAPEIDGMTPISDVITLTTTYTQYEFDLSDYAGETVYVAIVYTGDDAYYAYIDQIEFWGENGTSTADTACVLFANDVHCGIEDNWGYAGLAAIRNYFESNGSDVLLVDAGDHIQGGPIGTLSHGQYIIDIMNYVGYDLAIPGNHEFDYTMEQFFNLVDSANYPYVSANFMNYEDGQPTTPVLDAYKIFEIAGYKIAFVGLSTPETLVKSTPTYFQNADGEYIYGFCQDETGEGVYEACQNAIDAALEEGADQVVVIGHMGVDEQSEPWRSTDVIANISGCDFFIDGHSHSEIDTYVDDADGNPVHLLQTGTKFANIGCIYINEDGAVDAWLIPYTEENAEGYGAPDQPTQEFIDSIKAQYEELLHTVVAYTEHDLTVNDPETGERIVRKMETNLGDLCADAYRDLFDADVAFVNGGGVRANIPTGEVTFENILNVHPFGNSACLVEVTGQQILDALEMGSRNCPSENGGFLQCSGIQYEIHTYIPANVVLSTDNMWQSAGDGEYRVKNVKIMNHETGEYEPIDLDAIYTLASHNYMLKSCGDGFGMFGTNNITLLADEVKLDNAVLIDYISTMPGGTVDETEYDHIISDYEDPYGEGRIIIVNEEPVPEGPVLGYYFESDDEIADFILLDEDGDNSTWARGTGYSYEGTGQMGSGYNSDIDVNNWMVMPEFHVPEIDPSMTLYARARSTTWGSEFFGVFVGTDPEDVSTFQQVGETIEVDHTTYEQYSFDLSDYAGETVYVAVRHFNCIDTFYLYIDQVEFWGEFDDTPVEPELIDTIEINGFVEPAWGENPFYNVTVPADAHYTLDYTDWNWWSDELDDGDILDPSEAFDNEDYVYYQYFEFLPEEGYVFADDVTVLVNGNAAIIENCGVSSYGYAWAYTIDFEVDEPVEPPVHDLDEALNVEGGELHFETSEDYPWETFTDGDRLAAWSTNNGAHSTTSAVWTTVTANDGDTVSFDFMAWGEGSNTYWDKCEFLVDGVTVMSWGAYQNNDWETYEYTFTADGEHELRWQYSKDSSVNPTGDYFAVDEVQVTEGEEPPVLEVIDTVEILNFVEPAWGEAPFYGITVPEDAHYYIDDSAWFWWFNGDGDLMGEDDIFNVPSVAYYMGIIIVPEEGYEFAEDVTVLINGETEFVSDVYYEEYGLEIYTIDFVVCFYGDVDLDGEVTVADALLAMRYAMGLIELTEEQLVQMDVNGDGVYDLVDATLILRYAMGIIDYFPVEPIPEGPIEPQ